MTLEMIANLGAVGVIGLIAYLLVKAGIDQQRGLIDTNKEIADSFKNTIDNHLDTHNKSEKALADAIKDLTREIKNGRRK